MDKQSRERDKITHGFKIKRALKNGLFYGLALEVMAITGGYLVYKEYKSNEGKNCVVHRNELIALIMK